MHDGMPYGRNQGQGQGHSREVDRQSPTGLCYVVYYTICTNSAQGKVRSCVNLLCTVPVWRLSSRKEKRVSPATIDIACGHRHYCSATCVQAPSILHFRSTVGYVNNGSCRNRIVVIAKSHAISCRSLIVHRHNQ